MSDKVEEIPEKDKPFYLSLIAVGMLMGEVALIAFVPAIGDVLVGNGILAGTFTLVVSSFSYYFGKKS